MPCSFLSRRYFGISCAHAISRLLNREVCVVWVVVGGRFQWQLVPRL
jgi:hypothetical protein